MDLLRRKDTLGLLLVLTFAVFLAAHTEVGASFAQPLAEIRQAAEQGDAEAQFYLGEAFYTGTALPRDYTAAASWYKKAAAQGSAAAQNRLGAMYASGQGLSKDRQQALYFYQQAAEQGLVEAQTNLAFLLAKTDSRAQDAVQAYAWYSVAANQGYENAIQGRELAACRLTPEQRIQAIIAAAELQAKIGSGQQNRQ